jgi:hypothetical protein
VSGQAEETSPVSNGPTAAPALACGAAAENDQVWLDARIDDAPVRVTLGTGADYTIMSSKALTLVKGRGAAVAVQQMREPKKLLSFSSEPMWIDDEAVFNIILPTECGDLVLRNVKAWMSKYPLPSGQGDVLLSRDIMRTLGYDRYALFSKVRRNCAEYEIGGVVEPTVEERNFDNMEYIRFLPSMDVSKHDERAKVMSIRKSKISDATRAGESPSFAKKSFQFTAEIC